MSEWQIVEHLVTNIFAIIGIAATLLWLTNHAARIAKRWLRNRPRPAPS